MTLNKKCTNSFTTMYVNQTKKYTHILFVVTKSISFIQCNTDISRDRRKNTFDGTEDKLSDHSCCRINRGRINLVAL